MSTGGHLSLEHEAAVAAAQTVAEQVNAIHGVTAEVSDKLTPRSQSVGIGMQGTPRGDTHTYYVHEVSITVKVEPSGES